MPEIDAARLGYAWGWDEGEDGWKNGVDTNFRKNDTYTGLSIIDDTLTAPPGSPADGDTYIPAATATGAWATHEGQIASYQAGTWYFYPVALGLRALFVASSEFKSYDGSAWVTENSYPRLPAEVQNIPIPFPFVGIPPAGLTIYIPIVQDTDIPANLAGTIGYAATPGTVADADVTFSYIRAGTPHAMSAVTFAVGDNGATLPTATAVHLLTGDILVCAAPNPQNATLADFTVTLLAKKV